MQFIDLKSRHKLIGDKINARIQKVMNHGQFILGPEVRELNRNSLNTPVQNIVLQSLAVRILPYCTYGIEYWGRG